VALKSILTPKITQIKNKKISEAAYLSLPFSKWHIKQRSLVSKDKQW